MIKKPHIACAYYAVPFSKPNVKKLDKILNKLTNKTCNLPKSTAIILTHLSHANFGIDTTSLLPCQLHRATTNIQALIDQGQLGAIYQGLAKHISAKYDGSQHLPTPQYQTCVRSPIACTIYLLERKYEIFVNMDSKSSQSNKHQRNHMENSPHYTSLINPN